MRDIRAKRRATRLSHVKLVDNVTPIVRSSLDCRLVALFSVVQIGIRCGSTKTLTGVVAEVRDRLLEQCKGEIMGVKEYPTEESVEC